MIRTCGLEGYHNRGKIAVVRCKDFEELSKALGVHERTQGEHDFGLLIKSRHRKRIFRYVNTHKETIPTTTSMLFF